MDHTIIGHLYSTITKIPPSEKVFRKVNNLLSLFRKDKSKIKILDASGGKDAATTIYLAKRGYDVYYTEVDQKFVKNTKDKLFKLNPKFKKPKNRVSYSYFQDLPRIYPMNYFDAIHSVMTFHHGKWDEIKSYVNSFYKVLKEEGYLQLVFHCYVPNHKMITGNKRKVKGPIQPGLKIENVPPINPKHLHDKHTYYFDENNHNYRRGYFHLFTKPEINELFKKFRIIKLEKVKMFYSMNDYWHLIVQKK
jgi:SAM-dependent methyltransferase